jgi:DNA gyrase subunit A
MGRSARGVRGIRMPAGARVISLVIPAEDGYLLTASEYGYGKRTRVDEFPVKGRGAQGVIAIRTSERNGAVVGAVQVFEGDELMFISDLGTLVRTGADQVSMQGRNTQGVRLINLRGEEVLIGVARIEDPENGADVAAGTDGVA